jgi:hypothetical protein
MKRATRILVSSAMAASAVVVVLWPGGAMAAPRLGARAARTAVTPAAVTPTTATPVSAAPTTSTPTTTTTSTTAAPGPGAVTASPPSDPTCSPATLHAVQQVVGSELSGRVTQLNTLLGDVDNQSNQLTASDRATLQNDISNVELPGITALQPQVQQARTCLQVKSLAHTMVFDYRVYLVMTPQTGLTIAADNEVGIENAFVALEPGIAAAIQAAQARGENVAAAQAADNDLVGQVTAASTATSGLSAQLLAQMPQGSPGNWPVFVAAGQSTARAGQDLHTAYTDAQQIKTDLT